MKLTQTCITTLLLMFLGINVSAAHSTTSENEKVTILMKQALPDAPGHKGIMETVEFLPAQSSKPHKHTGSVFAYVLEGSIVSQLDGQKAVTYHQGEYWYEPPFVGHLVCKNASDSKTAKLVVWQLINNDSAALVPLSLKSEEPQLSPSRD
jgi:quercetin dioxygenase-like cupin family protein